MDIERRQMLNLYDDLTNCVYMIKKSPNNATMEDFKNCLVKLFTYHVNISRCTTLPFSPK